MFTGLRVLFAKNRVINELANEGIMTRRDAEHMIAVSGNVANYQYACSLLKARVASSKYSAVAAAFARIAAASLRTGSISPLQLRGVGFNPLLWVDAACRALEIDGASSQESIKVVQGLMEMNDQIERKAVAAL